MSDEDKNKPLKEQDKLFYEKSFESKHHYDILSWTISVAFVAVLGLIIGLIYSLQTSVATIGLAIIGIILCIIWLIAYERNRFWAEVANETARDIERKYETAGPAIEFMKANLDNQIRLKNTDENGKELAGARIEKPLFPRSMHWGIRGLVYIITFLIVLSVTAKYLWLE